MDFLASSVLWSSPQAEDLINSSFLFLWAASLTFTISLSEGRWLHEGWFYHPSHLLTLFHLKIKNKFFPSGRFILLLLLSHQTCARIVPFLGKATEQQIICLETSSSHPSLHITDFQTAGTNNLDPLPLLPYCLLKSGFLLDHFMKDKTVQVTRYLITTSCALDSDLMSCACFANLICVTHASFVNPSSKIYLVWRNPWYPQTFSKVSSLFPWLLYFSSLLAFSL